MLQCDPTRPHLHDLAPAMPSMSRCPGATFAHRGIADALSDQSPTPDPGNDIIRISSSTSCQLEHRSGLRRSAGPGGCHQM